MRRFTGWGIILLATFFLSPEVSAVNHTTPDGYVVGCEPAGIILDQKGHVTSCVLEQTPNRQGFQNFHNAQHTVVGCKQGMRVFLDAKGNLLSCWLGNPVPDKKLIATYVNARKYSVSCKPDHPVQFDERGYLIHCVNGTDAAYANARQYSVNCKRHADIYFDEKGYVTRCTIYGDVSYPDAHNYSVLCKDSSEVCFDEKGNVIKCPPVKASPASPSGDFAKIQTIDVVEVCGQKHWNGVWKRQGTSNVFDATWDLYEGNTLKAKSGVHDVIEFTGIKGNRITFHRRGTNGNYFGDLSSDGLRVTNGGMSWHPAGCSWTAKLSPGKPAPTPPESTRSAVPAFWF